MGGGRLPGHLHRLEVFVRVDVATVGRGEGQHCPGVPGMMSRWLHYLSISSSL